jgi:peptidoglycan LD-endopeptidase LytH
MAKLAAIFFIGFALGALVIAVVLWSTGALKTPAMRASNEPLPAAPLPLRFGESARDVPSPLNPPISTLPQDLSQPNATSKIPLKLMMPIASVDPNSLRDSFSELRDGHRHEALDIPAPRGTPVLAAAEGNVIKLFTSKPGGLTLYEFDDSRQYCFYYAHLDHYAQGMRQGVLLRPGQVLGYVGTTGDAPPDAPHLHFAVFRLGPEKKWYQGTPIDPLPLLRNE